MPELVLFQKVERQTFWRSTIRVGISKYVGNRYIKVERSNVLVCATGISKYVGNLDSRCGCLCRKVRHSQNANSPKEHHMPARETLMASNSTPAAIANANQSTSPLLPVSIIATCLSWRSSKTHTELMVMNDRSTFFDHCPIFVNG